MADLLAYPDRACLAGVLGRLGAELFGSMRELAASILLYALGTEALSLVMLKM